MLALKFSVRTGNTGDPLPQKIIPAFTLAQGYSADSGGQIWPTRTINRARWIKRHRRMREPWGMRAAAYCFFSTASLFSSVAIAASSLSNVA